ncbi:MAG TPA: DNA primase DnaG [Candidatus Poseidoniaceae archaeon]|nr:DNA primase DnaG [Candidatus Poseidoniaceae archaeon]
MAKNQKNQKNTMKYMIIAEIKVDGTVQRKDVVGALFGQCEGLLGDDLDLRKLQRSTKIGMIEVNIKSEKGKVNGEILIPSSMDNVETAIIGAAISTIERIGPCNSKIKVKEIQDVRATKRTQVVELAKDLLLRLVSDSSSTSKSVIDEVRSVLTTEQSQFFHGLTCGPNIESSSSLIVCEGRNDVRNLLSAGLKNVICTDGAGEIKQELIDLANTKESVIVAIDGDRGGEMLLLQLVELMKVDYVAQAPVGQEWELLPNKTITKCLAMKEPADRFAARISDDKEKTETPKVQPTEQITDYAEHISKIGAREAILIFEDDSISDPIGASKLAAGIEESERTVLAIVYNGQLSKRMFDIATKAKVPTIIGTSIKSGEEPDSELEAWATSDWT